MHIYVMIKNLKSIPLDVKTSDTVGALKRQIQHRVDIVPRFQRLVFAGKELENGRTLCEYSVHKEVSIRLLLNPPPNTAHVGRRRIYFAGTKVTNCVW